MICYVFSDIRTHPIYDLIHIGIGISTRSTVRCEISLACYSGDDEMSLPKVYVISSFRRSVGIINKLRLFK
jgi:hypothetical protein